MSDGNAVYIGAGTNDTGEGESGASVSALLPTDGSVLWSHNFGTQSSIGQVTVDSNRGRAEAVPIEPLCHFGIEHR